jgi:hypothetical protein
MPANHRLNFDVTCPTCATRGAITLIEDAGPPFTEAPRRTFNSRDNKFVVTSEEPPAVACASCGTVIGSLYEPCLD